jgi:hypothetical protein
MELFRPMLEPAAFLGKRRIASRGRATDFSQVANRLDVLHNRVPALRAMPMTRFTFWIVNILGMYLILTRTEPEFTEPRALIGFALVGLGTFGILGMHLFQHFKRTRGDTAPDDQKQD